MSSWRGVRRDCYGFLTRGELAVLAADRSYRLQLVLGRCGGCRFICPAQDAGHLFEIIGRDGRDYVRDVAVWEPA